MDWDENFAYIADRTSWGFPYGVTWEEKARMDAEEEEESLRAQWFAIVVDEDAVPEAIRGGHSEGAG